MMIWYASPCEFTRCNCVPVGYNLEVHPEGEFIKANFNGAVFMESGKAGIGVVLRDSSGQPIAALSASIPLPSTVEEVEFLAARQALLLASQMKWVCKG